MKNLTKIFFLICQFLSVSVTAQVTQEWVQKYNSGSNYNDIVNDMTIDKFGNIFLAGYSNTSSTDDDFVTLKYNSEGVLQWVRNYNGSNNGRDRSIKVLVDDSGFVFVTGESQWNFLTIKYTPDGDTVWRREFSSFSVSSPRDMIIDDSSNVYITGYGSSCGGCPSEYMTIKYDKDGNLQWVRFYNNLSPDIPSSIAIDSNKRIIVTGSGATVIYSSNGDFLKELLIGNFVSRQVIIDNENNFYLGGQYWTGIQNQNDIFLSKYNDSDSILWTSTYNTFVPPGPPPFNPNDYFRSMVLSYNNENIYLTGLSNFHNQNGWDYLILKYNTEGDTLWKRGYRPNVNSDNQSRHITVDKYENIYITGSSDYNTPFRRFLTVKYDSSGNLIWSRNYFDYPFADNLGIKVLLDSSGNVYVGGTSYNVQTGSDITLIKYSQVLDVNTLSEKIPSEYELYQNYPNPFNPLTTITFSLPHSGRVQLNIYNALGQLVSIPVSEHKQPGTYSVTFDASDLPSGVYYYKLDIDHTGETGYYSQTRKMILLK